MLTKKKSLLLITLILIAVNLFSVYQYPLEQFRILRGVTSFVFLLVFSFYGGFKKRLLFYALLSFFVSDMFVSRYDELAYNNLTSISATIGYMLIGLYLFPKFKLSSVKKRIVTIFIVLISISAYMFYEVIGLMQIRLHSELHRYIYYVYCLVLLGLLVLVGNYNFRYNSTQSTYCMLFVFALVVSNLFAAISYYLSMPLFYYPTRFFYVVGLGLLTAFAVLPFEKELLLEEEN